MHSNRIIHVFVSYTSISEKKHYDETFFQKNAIYNISISILRTNMGMISSLSQETSLPGNIHFVGPIVQKIFLPQSGKNTAEIFLNSPIKIPSKHGPVPTLLSMFVKLTK